MLEEDMSMETFAPPFQHPLVSNDATNPGFDAYIALQTQTSIPSDNNNVPQIAYECFKPQEPEEPYTSAYHQLLKYIGANTSQTYFGGHKSYSAHGMTPNTTQTHCDGWGMRTRQE